ncbi:MAG TPA: hypothetical protein VFA07_00120 [Chthonomonadaceae bacterium]|nr:hypothetical protein [Chthonomonadaceae bacterium]
MKRQAGAQASLLTLGLLLGSACSHADIVPQFQSATHSGGDYRWIYQIDLTGGERIRKGNYFTIYDFAGFIPGSNFQPVNWVFSTALVGKTPKGAGIVDNSKIPNLTWTYMGRPTGGFNLIDLGLFGALSKYGKGQLSDYVGTGRRYAPHARGNGKPMITTGTIEVPQAIAPEGGSLSLLLPGLATLGLLLRKRSRQG